MNNKVFYQHPNLMRALGMHETVMEVMVNVLGGGESKVMPRVRWVLRMENLGNSTDASTPPPGDPLPQDGDQLLPLPLLLLPHQPPESALHVRPLELPAGEQWHQFG